MPEVKMYGIDEISNATNGKLTLGDPVVFNKPIRAQASLCPGGVMDLSLSNYFICNCTGSITYSFSNVPTDSDVISLVLELHDAGSHVLTFPANVQWGGGVAPTFTAGASDLVGFISTDAGNNWRGMGLNFNSAITFNDPT
jgi:hypothetical protein